MERDWPFALAPIALQPDTEGVLRTAAASAREVAGADSVFVAVRDSDGFYPMGIRLGLSDPAWPSIRIVNARGLGGLCIQDLLSRTSHDYQAESSITADYQPIMRRERLRGLAVVPIRAVGPASANSQPVGLIYVSTRAKGAPGDRVVEEVQRIAEMAAVGVAHLNPAVRTDRTRTGGLSPRELDVLHLLGEGASNQMIAKRLCIAEATAKGHLRAILRKLEVSSRLAAVAKARRSGIL